MRKISATSQYVSEEYKILLRCEGMDGSRKAQLGLPLAANEVRYN